MPHPERPRSLSVRPPPFVDRLAPPGRCTRLATAALAHAACCNGCPQKKCLLWPRDRLRALCRPDQYRHQHVRPRSLPAFSALHSLTAARCPLLVSPGPTSSNQLEWLQPKTPHRLPPSASAAASVSRTPHAFTSAPSPAAGSHPNPQRCPCVPESHGLCPQWQASGVRVHQRTGPLAQRHARAGHQARGRAPLACCSAGTVREGAVGSWRVLKANAHLSALCERATGVVSWLGRLWIPVRAAAQRPDSCDGDDLS